MNILAIETATPVCAIGVSSTRGASVTRIVDHDRRHTEALVPGIVDLLDECALRPRDIDRVVIDGGPGLFTGLRVGIATATSFARAIGCGIVAVTSLELLAHGARDAGVRGVLVCAVDGRRGEVFGQSFTLGDGVEVLDSARPATPHELVIEAVTLASPVTYTGDGVERYLSDFQSIPHATVFAQSVPSLHAALELGRVRDLDEVVTPLYLRDADAVANFTTRQRPS